VLKDRETVNEAAARLDALPRLVQRWCKDGKLPCRKVGRDWLVERGAEPRVIRRKQSLAREEKG
jgi:excisionase family DNA binding protein